MRIDESSQELRCINVTNLLRLKQFCWSNIARYLRTCTQRKILQQVTGLKVKGMHIKLITLPFERIRFQYTVAVVYISFELCHGVKLEQYKCRLRGAVQKNLPA